MTGPSITYEGIDASHDEARWLDAMELPGTRVRFDPEANLRGIDPHETMDALGMDPLVVSKSIVRTSMSPNGMDGERPSSILEYEFEGREGRHNAKQFVEEGGRDRVYGVAMMRDDRMWMVPIHRDDENAAFLDGPAREVVGYAERTDPEGPFGALHPDGFDAMRTQLLSAPIAGEFHTQPRDGYRAPGPIVLLGSPLQTTTDEAERTLANAAIDKAVARETLLREDPVRFHLDEMESSSRAFRIERPVRTDTVGVTSAQFEARQEMLHLLKGRDRDDASVRMAAAMAATDGRPGDQDARRLADSFAPGAETPKSRLFDQAAAITPGARVQSRGMTPDTFMPPYGAGKMRRDDQGR